MELLIMACPASCAYNEIRVPLTGPECDTLASGTGIDGITDVCDYLQSLPVRLFDIQNHLEGLGNYGALPINEDSKCKPSEAPTASSLVSEIARAINAITCFLCGVGGGSKSHFHDETGDFNQLATTPLNIPADLDINDTVIEDFDDYLVFWTWDGTTWTKNFVHDKADANSAFQTHNQNIPTPTYTTPLTPPANPEAGDTIIEQYLDGIVYWTFDGTNWVKNFTDSKDIHSYHVLQAGNAPSLTPIFPVPITTAQAGDTAIVRWDNGEAKYTYNGVSWVLDWFNEDASAIAVEDANGNVTVLNGNGNIPTDCTLEVNGGILSLATISAQASLSVGNTPVAPTPASGAVIVPTQTISITNPSACRSMAYLFVCPGVDMSIVGASTNGAFLGIQSQININGGAFFQTSDTTLSTNGVSGVGYLGHDSNTNGHVLTGTIAPGASVSIGLRVQFIKGSAAGTYSSLVVQGFHMSIIGSLI